MKQVKIFGHGEIGQSLHEVYERAGWFGIAWRDLDTGSGPDKCDILNVCIPFSDQFVSIVAREIWWSDARIVIIHSTVAPGTTKEIIDLVKDKDVLIVHSPVIGVHPNLAEGIQTFTKWIGCETNANAELVREHFNQIGIPNTRKVTPAISTEIAKLMDTTYYGACLAVNAEATEWLNSQGTRSSFWVEYLMEYNRGYQTLGMGNIVRPYFPALNMPIGGHCVGNNARILKQVHDFPALDQIIKYLPNEN